MLKERYDPGSTFQNIKRKCKYTANFNLVMYFRLEKEEV